MLTCVASMCRIHAIKHSFKIFSLFIIFVAFRVFTTKIQSEDHSLGICSQSPTEDLLKSFYDIAGISLRSNKDITYLSSDDRSILLHTAAIDQNIISNISFF